MIPGFDETADAWIWLFAAVGVGAALIGLYHTIADVRRSQAMLRRLRGQTSK